MKQKTSILFITLAAVIATGCSKEITDETAGGGPVVGPKMRTITLTAGSGMSTRVAHEDADGTVSLKWSTGDEILVESIVESTATYSTFTLSEGAGTMTGLFTGEIPEDATSINVYYPADIHETALDMAAQSQSESGSMAHLADRNIMSAAGIEVGESDELDFSFTHRGMIFTLPVKNLSGEQQDIIGITLTNEKDAAVRSVFAKSLSLADGVVSSKGAPSLTLAVADGEVADGDSFNAYFMLFMEDYTALNANDLGLDIFVHTQKGRHLTTKTTVPSFLAGFRYTLNGIELTAANFDDGIYMVGSAAYGQYDLSHKIAFTNNEDGTYGWNGPLMAGDFKFIDGIDSWGDQVFELYSDGAGSAFVNDYDAAAAKFAVANEGSYTIGIDFNTMAVSISEPSLFRFVCPVGDATPTAWAIGSQYFTDVEEVAGEIVVKGSLELSEGGLKFLRRQSYDGLTIHPDADGDVDLTPGTEYDFVVRTTGGDDYKWLVSPANAGNYDVTLNLTTLRIKFERKGTVAPTYGNDEF